MKSTKNLFLIFLITTVLLGVSICSINMQANPQTISTVTEKNTALQNQDCATSYTRDWNTSFHLLTHEVAYDLKVYGGAIYVTGYAYSPDKNVLLQKYDLSGNRLWSYTWGGGNADEGTALAIDSNGNIYVTGQYTNIDADVVLVKFNSSGSYLWHQTWDNAASEKGTDIVIDNVDNYIYITGWTNGGDGIFILKYDPTGILQWKYQYNGPGLDSARAITFHDDSVYVTGYGNNQLLLLRQHEDNLTYPIKSWNTPGFDQGNDLAFDSEGNLYVCGYSTGIGYGDDDAILLKFDSNRDSLWNRTWGCINDDTAYGLTINSQDEIFITGVTPISGSADIFVVKYDNEGNQPWSVLWDAGGTEAAYAITGDGDNLYIAGYTDSYGTGMDVILLKYTADAGTNGGIPGFQLPLLLLSIISLIAGIIIFRDRYNNL